MYKRQTWYWWLLLPSTKNIYRPFGLDPYCSVSTGSRLVGCATLRSTILVGESLRALWRLTSLHPTLRTCDPVQTYYLSKFPLLHYIILVFNNLPPKKKSIVYNLHMQKPWTITCPSARYIPNRHLMIIRHSHHIPSLITLSRVSRQFSKPGISTFFTFTFFAFSCTLLLSTCPYLRQKF